ncbi:MAG: polysaccharide deacetylase family protein [Gammaproteobacteria bacterium]|jgi:peptidoglycan/xylan/chitin deacetylase (PgdA/CDA1 family)|nr:polysaccharide deacetylase family protein [Gammaproteobacteria bacterium]
MLSLRHALRLFAILYAIAFPVQAAQHINVLLYHHVSANTPPATSVSPDTFAGHMQYLHEHGYQVIDLGQALSLIQAKQELPANSVAITFDDAWRNIYTNALPIMEEYNYPFTVFVNTDPVDQNNGMAMTWDMLRDIKQRGGTLANHTRDHDYLVRKADYNQQWLADTLANIDFAQQRLQTETGSTPRWLAYPYGEYNQALKQALKARGYLAFGQHSGGIAAFSDWQALPRFPAAGPYSNLKTLRLKLASQPMPVDYQALPDTVIRLDQAANNPPTLSVKMLQQEKKGVRDQLRCFILGTAQTPTWQSQQHWQVSAAQALPSGRSRYNCTAPVWGQNNYYWLSQQWLVYKH